MNELISLMTAEEKVAGGTTIARLGVNAGRGGGGEGLHGVAWSGRATVFPNSLGLSQTWDDDLLYKVGEVIARESLAIGITSVGRLTPVVDLLRDPRYGRAYETLGEDGFLTGSLATAIASGMNQRSEEGYQQFQPILKHFMAYNAEINRLWVASTFTPRNMQEYYVKSFKYPVSAGASKSLMNSYPVVNGKPMSVNPIQGELLNSWTPDYKSKLEGGDGATGHYEYKTTNDYGSGSSIVVHSQRYFPDTNYGRTLGIAEGIKNGQQGWSFRDWGSASGLQYHGLATGMSTVEDYAEYARRNVAMALRDGSLDHIELQSPYLDPDYITGLGTRDTAIQEHKDLAYQASLEQIVLLKNDGILPLSASTDDVVLLGPLSDQVLKDFYSGNYHYRITIKDALENKLGADHVAFNRAVDSVAIKAPNGNYLSTPDNTYRTVGTVNAADTPITASLAEKPASVADKNGLFEIYDYGSTIKLLRTPLNGRYVQVTRGTNNPGYTFINNTSAPAEGTLNEFSGNGQNLNFTNFTSFRLVDLEGADAGKTAIYNLIAGNGTNGGTGYAYDVDDEDTNRGSFIKLNTAPGAAQNRLLADVSTNGPYKNEYNVNNSKLPTLTDEFKFTFENVQSSEEAIEETIANAPADAPIVLVVGYEPHVNAREAIDLYQTGLSDQQMRMINYITDTKERDLILILKAGNPMVIDASVQNNPKVKAILNIGSTGQEEGSAIATVLFEDGYQVPLDGNWVPREELHNIGLPGHQVHASYPGYAGPAGDGVFPAASPAGRLSATWYDGVDQMIGASEEHAPASYVFPAFDEETNDNFSNMNGTINTGLLTYDIIKGERTYQYLNSAPLYAFGYGLTYTDFEYSDLNVSELSGGKFTVSGTVENVGSKASDEVVEIYGRYAGVPTRIKQANNRLLAYDRLMNIQPGDTRSFSFEIDLLDKLGVWDVEAGEMIVEPGAYAIKAAPSSDAAGGAGTLTVTTSNGGKAAAQRDLQTLTLAENFDDYSNVGGKVDDVEMISSSIAYDSDTAVQIRKDGAWINFKNAAFSSAPTLLTLSVGSDRAGSLKVYSGDPGSGGTLIATVPLTDSRPVTGLPAGAGIGPAGAYPGSAAGKATDDNYVKPELNTVSVPVSGLGAGAGQDIYIVSDNRGSIIHWVKFGSSPDVTDSISISNVYSLDSIRVKGETLALDADLTPLSSLSPVTWSVSAKSGGPTNLAMINQKGELTALGAGNGTVVVTAASAGKTATKEILITNQLDSNKVTVSNAPKTVDFLMIRTGGSFGANDSIWRYKGTNQQTAVFLEQLSENAAGYYTPNTGLTVPTAQITWSVTDLDGAVTDLATINAAGLLSATGVDDGQVKVKAVLNTNPDITAERVITLQGQGVKNGSRWIQAELYDTGTSFTGNTSAFSTTNGIGNEMGLYSIATTTAANPSTALYKNVDLGYAANGFYIRSASTSNATVQVWIDGNTADTGTLISTVNLPASDNINQFTTKEAVFDEEYSGIHDVYLVFPAGASRSIRVNWFQFSTKFALQFDDANASSASPETQIILPGDTGSAPPVPQKGDAEFLGWYPNTDFSGEPWDFDKDTLESNTTLTAKWKGTYLKANTSLRINLRLRTTYQLTPDSDGNSYVYTSSNPAVARVDQSGKITPVRAGTTTISVRLSDGSDLLASALVSVTP
jgi:beta-glucosidase